MTYYLFNSNKYYSLDALRQEVWSANHLVFGELTSDLMTSLGITEETEPEPERTEEDILQDELNFQLREKENRISEIKDELLTAVLLDDTDAQATLKAEYKELLA